LVYTRRVKPERQRSLISMIFSYGAQLAYVEESRGVYELLSKSDRLFRYINGRKSLILLRDDLSILQTYIDIINICTPHSLEYHIDYTLNEKSYYVKKCTSIDLFDKTYSSLTKKNIIGSPLIIRIRALNENFGEIGFKSDSFESTFSFPMSFSIEGKND